MMDLVPWTTFTAINGKTQNVQDGLGAKYRRKGHWKVMTGWGYLCLPYGDGVLVSSPYWSSCDGIAWGHKRQRGTGHVFSRFYVCRNMFLFMGRKKNRLGRRFPADAKDDIANSPSVLGDDCIL